jgi:hypothetical protein
MQERHARRDLLQHAADETRAELLVGGLGHADEISDGASE